MEAFATVWNFLVKGGVIMIPLALCSLVGLAVLIEKLYSLRRNKVLIPEIINVLENIRSEEDIPLAVNICEQHQGPFANIVMTVLRYRNQPKAELKELVEETGRQEVRTLERGLVALETVAGVAPLLGLLGTVIGILKIFNVISEVGMGQASALSGGLSEALITTIIGLSIGIPSLVFYNYFVDKAEQLILEIEKYSSALIMKLKSFESQELDLIDAS
ncbi:MAG: MotA/TolQ/ExbB proton channel family protein [candidate division KSB1 bacterium]|nr:MotA/TolQ/ExbB proton channel family protein [candidate division KSB1 bacterium]MDQ7064073.1 MotA/TolQ/ExbB proton channel family protein [candidate division KSB1 bacterium]